MKALRTLLALMTLLFVAACDSGDNPTTPSASAAEVEADSRSNPYPEEALDVSPETDDKRLKETQDAIIEETALRPTPTLQPLPAKPKLPKRPGAK